MKITFTGDILCQQDMTENSGKNYFPMLEKCDTLFKNTDYLVGNLETPIAGGELGFTNERYCFNTPNEFLDMLKNAGFNLLSLANNHCMDRGEEGMLNTLANCKKYGFDTVGVHENAAEREKIFVKELGGIKVAFVNYTYGTNAFAHHRFIKDGNGYLVNLFQPEETKEGAIHLLLPAGEIEKKVKEIYFGDGEVYERCVKEYLDRLQGDIARAKEQADFVIMLAHIGGQRNAEPDAYSKLIMGKIKEFGADVIVGLHPHVIHPCDTENGYLTVYDLGNFLCSEESFHNDTDIDQSVSAILHLYLQKVNGKVKMEVGFQISKLVTEKGVPVVYNLYDLYQKTGDESLKALSVKYANFFAGKEIYTEIADEYILQF